MPDKEQLSTYLDSGFSDTEKDFSTYISVLEAIGAKKGDSLFDFGCSWGYGSWQLKKYGFEVESLEVSLLRADYARKKLAINVHNSISEVSGSFDIFFSSHVLEHVPSVDQVIDFGLNILKPRGLFVAFTPNGSKSHRSKNPKDWHNLWGLVHPNFLDEIYYKNRFSENPFLLTSNKYKMCDLAIWCDNQNAQTILDLEDRELLVVARK